MTSTLKDEGLVIAVKGLQVEPPWEVLESNQYKGRFFFYRGDNNERAWALPASVLGFASPGTANADMMTQGARSPSSVAQAPPAPDEFPLESLYDGDYVPGMDQSTKGCVIPPSRHLGSGSTPGTSGTISVQFSSESLDALPHLTRNSSSDVQSALNGQRCDTVITDGQAPLRVTGGLGRGGYAVVVRAEHTQTGEEYALKVVSKARLTRPRDRKRLGTELKVMTQLPPSPFVQRCHMAFESSTHVFFALDLVAGGDLFFHLIRRIMSKNWGFVEDEARVLLSEVVVALEHMHAHGFIHRDIKVENIMVDARGHVKLIDMGLACRIADEPRSPVGSLAYMSPETLAGKPAGRHSDWWSVGVLAFELMTGRSPWSSLADKKLIKKEIKSMKVVPPRRLSSPAGLFITSLLKQDATKRLGTKSDQEIHSASFFQKIDWDETTHQENRPAFVPGDNAFDESECDEALFTYIRKPSSTTESDSNSLSKSSSMESLPKTTQKTTGIFGSYSSGSLPALVAKHEAEEDWWLGLAQITTKPEVGSRL
mmetsp:Transcript_25859/g.57953  ORF Transcript_25859/g.57953 Transcript_25859/m.57953 type:complete len:540 (-) Transcript_25859:254-1873(-)